MNSQVDDVAVFWVLPRTSIEDIEDQWLPFSRIELDTYLKNISPDLVEWSAQGMTCLNVEIDPVTHVATVTNPDGGCTEPETIVFTARSVIHGIEVRLTADVTFTPAFLLAVDIKPGSCANPLNVKSKGKLPVAVLGTGDLDVGTLDPETVQLEGVPALMWTHEDVGKPAESHGDCACHEEGPDGSMDMTLKFDRQEVIAALGEVEHGHICALRLSGRTHDGVPVEGWDCVRIAEGRAKNPGGFAGPVTVTGRKVNLSLEVPTAVSVKVYDVTGRIVRTLSSRPRAAGILAFEWDGCDDAGRPVVGGVYFCRVKAGSVTETVRMVISR
jgi:hypothetical protein